MPICPYAWSAARRFSTISKTTSSETDKNGPRLESINTVTILESGLTLEKNSRTFRLKSNMAGTTSREKTKLDQTIQNCWDKKSHKYKNLHKVIFSKETLQIAYYKTLSKRKIISKGENVNNDIFKNISD